MQSNEFKVRADKIFAILEKFQERHEKGVPDNIIQLLILMDTDMLEEYLDDYR